MKKILIAAAAVAVATPAFAQDAEPSFTGLRIEARAGLDRPTVSLEATDGADTIERSEGKSGLVYGGEIGYDIQIGSRAFVGGYAGIEGATTKACAEITVGSEYCIAAGRNITLGGRAGLIAAGGKLGLYLKGGYSNGRLTASYATLPPGPVLLADEDNEVSGNLDGFHLGAGVEFNVTRNIYLKAEYVYSNYGSYRDNDNGARASVSLDRHQAVAGVGFRF
jgi:outer membrane immunogenic protein